MAVKLIYIDDSGATATGYIVYSWAEVDIVDWRTGLKSWLDWRKSINRRYQIPVLQELHATKFIGGRGDPSLDAAWNRSKANRAMVTEQALATIGATSCLSVGTVYRQTTAKGRAFATEKAQVYDSLVQLLDARLSADGNLGIIVMDGDGTDASYYSPHRTLKLATRSIVEDPFFQHSHLSQWVQIADFVAYVAYQHLLRHPGKKFAWSWYSKYLAGSDVLGGPQQL